MLEMRAGDGRARPQRTSLAARARLGRWRRAEAHPALIPAASSKDATARVA